MNNNIVEDCLRRDEFIEKIKNIIEKMQENKIGSCFAIDGKWGSGKTYILNRLNEEFPKYNIETEEGCIIYNYDCWKYDYYVEPIEAIINILIKRNEKICSFYNGKEYELIKKLETSRSALLGILTNISVNKDDGTSYKDIENYIDELRELLTGFAVNNPIVIFVDEIDRCLPKYAIKILERLHHIFWGIDNLVTVVAVDKKQLEHTVDNIFGGNSAEEYLQKFFDFTLILDYGNLQNLYDIKFRDYLDCFDSNTDEKIVNQFLVNFGNDVEIRKLERIFNQAKLIHELIGSDRKHGMNILFAEILMIAEARGMTFASVGQDRIALRVSSVDGCMLNQVFTNFFEKESVNSFHGNYRFISCTNINDSAVLLYLLSFSSKKLVQDKSASNLVWKDERRKLLYSSELSAEEVEFVREFRRVKKLFQ